MSGVSIATGVIATDALGGGSGRGLQSPGVLAQSAVPASVTGTLSETTLATITIPAGAMGVNGSVRVRARFSYTGSTNNKAVRVRFGGAQLLFVDNANTAGNIGAQLLFDIANRGATNSQIGGSAGTGGVNAQIQNAFSASAIDTTAAVNLTLTAQLANTGETITLESYTVEILNP